jgi:hypothetical protein
MTAQRWKDLMWSDDLKLTEPELSEGWHWCPEFDGLLVGPGMGELRHCTCRPNTHPVYTTTPAEGEWSGALFEQETDKPK